MKLIEILLLTTSILTFLSGLIVFVGSSRKTKQASTWFFIATLGATIWIGCTAVFLMLPNKGHNTTEMSVIGIYSGAILMSIGLLFYNDQQNHLWRTISILFSLIGATLIGLLLLNPKLLYSGITPNYTIHINIDWYYLAYMTYFVLVTLIILIESLIQITKPKNKEQYLSKITFLIGFLITAIPLLIFNILLPSICSDLIWIGPLATNCMIIAFYYATLKYRLIDLTVRSLKFLSYLILIALGTMIYMLLFYVVFTILFKVPNPSNSVIVLNFIMIVIVLLLMPIINELNARIKSLISMRNINIAYIIKKLNKLAPKNINLKKLAKFLANNLHYNYVGLVVKGQLFGSNEKLLNKITDEELQKIAELKNVGKNIWQAPKDEKLKTTFEQLNISAVAELRNTNDEEFGQIIIGKPRGYNDYNHKDLLQIEMIINLVAAIISPTK